MPQRYREILRKEISKDVTDDDYRVMGKMFLSGIVSFAVASQIPNTIPVSVDFGIMGATAIATYNLPRICHWVKDKFVQRNQEEIKVFTKSLDKEGESRVQGVEITQELDNKIENKFGPFIFDKKKQKKSLVMKQTQEKTFSQER